MRERQRTALMLMVGLFPSDILSYSNKFLYIVEWIRDMIGNKLSIFILLMSICTVKERELE